MVSVESNIVEVVAKLKLLDGRQLPFAIARSLTDTAKEVQTEVKRQMPQRFTLRRDWIVKGIRITPATKQSLQAVVYSKDASFMARQEFGGDKDPKNGSRIAVPTENVRRTKTQIISRSETPAGLGTKGFVLETEDGRQFLAKRFARGKRAGLQILYALKPKTFVKPRLGLREIGTKIARSKFTAIFERNLINALKTARR